MKLPENIKRALEILACNGYEAYVVGGCVRDMIMGKSPNDFDITTNALPHQTAYCFKDYRVIETGIKHGTVTVVIDGENVEITTYRVDGEYLDNRRPENVSFTLSLEEDLSRRDFTMNAIAFSPYRGIVDPFGGAKDIERKIIRCVGEPDKRFNEDGLRILRAIRFAATTGFELEQYTAGSAIRNKNLINNISVERIFVEFKKLLCGKEAPAVIEKYSEIIAVFIPEITPTIGFLQNTRYHHLDVFSHTLAALGNSEADINVRLAVFLHDIGKPAAFFADTDGTAHFKGHSRISAIMARDILTRLKSDNETKNKVCDLIEMHSNNITNVKKFVSDKGFEFARLLIKVKRADASAKAPGYRDVSALDEAEKLIDTIQKNGEPVFLSDLAVSGDDVMALGAKGKKIGETLKFLLNRVISGQAENTKEILLEMAEVFLSGEKD